MFDEFGAAVSGQRDIVDEGPAGALAETESEDPGRGGVAADQSDDFLGVADFAVGQDEHLATEAGPRRFRVDFLEGFEDFRAAKVGLDGGRVRLGLRLNKALEKSSINTQLLLSLSYY